jgi:hypothetical protein
MAAPMSEQAAERKQKEERQEQDVPAADDEDQRG